MTKKKIERQERQGCKNKRRDGREKRDEEMRK
jgi:hypothetical protein